MPTDSKKFTWVSVLIIIGLLMIAAGFYAAFHPTKESVSTSDISESASSTESAMTPVPGNVSLEDINNATYTVWSNTEKVTLKNSAYQDNNAHITSTRTRYAIGDINGDVRPDALVVITTSRGDTMDELFAVFKQNGKIVTSPFLNISVGGGNSVRNINWVSIDAKGLVTLGLSVLGPNDPRSNPSMQGVYHFKFDGKHLIPA